MRVLGSADLESTVRAHMGEHLSSRVLAAARRHPIMSSVLAFILLRGLDIVVFWLVARRRGISLRDQLLGWDAGWLMNAALHGWPHQLPRDAAGIVEQSTLPWPPMVPLLGRSVAPLLGDGDGGIGKALVAWNLIGGACAAALLCLALLPFLGAGRALGTSILWSALPATPVLAMGYSEGVFTAFAFASLWAMTRHRYLLAGMLLVPAGLTKVTALPFAVTLVIAVIIYRRQEGSVRMTWWRLVAAIGLAGLAVVAWPAILAVRVGSWNALTQSHTAWGRSPVPFKDVIEWVPATVRETVPNTAIGILVMTAYVVAAVVVARDRRYPMPFRVLAVASPAFLLMVGPVLSTTREMLPNPALAAAIRGWIRSRWMLATVVAGLAVLGVGWIILFAAAGPGSPPP